MKGLRRFISALLAIIIALCSSIICFAENSGESNESILAANVTEITNELALTDIHYTYFGKTRATISVGTTFYKTGTLTSNDAIDFYPFSISSAKTTGFGFASSNSDYRAVLGVLDTSTGDVTLSNISLSPGTSTWTSNLPSGTYCWVVLSSNNTYTTDNYSLGMNASNPTGAAACMFLSADCSRAVFRYTRDGSNPSYYVYSNGTNVTNAIANYIANEMTSDTFNDRYEGPAPSNKRATVGVVSGPGYIIGNQTLCYGWYKSTNPYNNLVTGLSHTSYDVVFIPIYGYVYACSVSGSYINYQFIEDVATGFLVYDLHSGKIIDWMSSSNVLYAPTGYFGYEFEYGIYADLDFKL